MTPRSPKQRALQLLARREYTRAELKAKLLCYESADKIDILLDELENEKWLSDQRFAQLWIRQRAHRYGSQRLRYELRQKGIAEHWITEAITTYLEDEVAQAKKVWHTRYQTAPVTAQDKMKQIRFLQYRGYSWEIIRQVIEPIED